MSLAIIDRGVLGEIAARIGATVEPNNQKFVNRFTIESWSTDKNYIVSQRRTDGEWCCSCKGWIFNHSRADFKGCKHLIDMLGRLSGVQNGIAASMLESARTAFINLSDNKVAAIEDDFSIRINL